MVGGEAKHVQADLSLAELVLDGLLELLAAALAGVAVELRPVAPDAAQAAPVMGDAAVVAVAGQATKGMESVAEGQAQLAQALLGDGLCEVCREAAGAQAVARKLPEPPVWLRGHPA